MKTHNPSIARVIIAIFIIVNNILLVLNYEPINDDTVNAVITIVGNVYILYPIWKNNYLGNKGLKQKGELEKKDLV